MAVLQAQTCMTDQVLEYSVQQNKKQSEKILTFEKLKPENCQNINVLD